MKIAISGSHGVGKTTLARALAKELGLPMISEVAREEAKKFGYETTERIKNAPKLQRMIFQLSVYHAQIKAEEDTWQGFVSDRSIFDCVAYCIYYDLPLRLIEYLRSDAIQYSGKYDLIIYCPVPGRELEDDGFRLVDRESQSLVDTSIQILLEFAKCPVLRLGKGREKWQDEVLGYLEGVKTDVKNTFSKSM